MSNNIDTNASKKNFYRDLYSRREQVRKWYNLYQNDSIWSSSLKKRLNQAIDWLSEYTSKKQSIVLDLGCGTGITSNAIESLDHKIVGVDQAFSMVESAKANSWSAKSTIDFLQGDIEALPFKTKSVDFIVCLGVLPYLKTDQNAIKEIARVLKPRGIVILSFNRKVILREYLLILKRIINNVSSSNSVKKNQFRRQRSSIAKIDQTLYRNNFKPINIEVIDYNYLTLYWRKLFSSRFAIWLNQFLLRLSPKFPFNKLGDMYLVKAEKKDKINVIPP